MSPRVVLLQWLQPPRDTWNGELIGYVIKLIDEGQRRVIENREIRNNTNYTLTDLNTAYSYEFSVAARTTIGHGPFSESFFLFTLHDGKSRHS